MKIKKITKGATTTYFYDGVKKYQHFKNSDGYEYWSEYKDGQQIHFKNSDGFESWSDDNPENPKNWIRKKEVKPFEFNN